jgi:hypothetical protein
MIKTFEQFVAAKYGKPVNEGFQSSKLREIIKQHGLPKNDRDKKMLYDLKDNEIIDVVENRDEYSEKYDRPRKAGKDEATFMIELEDGACVVISNLDILKSYFQSNTDAIDAIKPRHSERHKGNLGKNYKDDHMKHLDNVYDLELKRLAERLQPHLPEIIEAVQSKLNEIDNDTFESRDAIFNDDAYNNGSEEFEIEINLDGGVYKIYGEYVYKKTNFESKYGAEYYDIEFKLDYFGVEDENENYVSDKALGVTPKTNKELFKQYTIYDIRGGMYDYYEYYGVSHSDFI